MNFENITYKMAVASIRHSPAPNQGFTFDLYDLAEPDQVSPQTSVDKPLIHQDISHTLFKHIQQSCRVLIITSITLLFIYNCNRSLKIHPSSHF